MRKLLAIGLAILSMSNAQAAFVNSDWQYAGDSRAVLDTTTGIEWLDLGYTNTWSIQAIYNLTLPGGSLAGWRLPTKAEVTTMMSHWFGTSFGTGFAQNNYSGSYPWAVGGFYNTFNFTYRTGETSNGHTWSMGLYADNGIVYEAGVYHRNSWGEHSASAWVNATTSYSISSGYTGRGVFLVSDGGTTLSSLADPTRNSANPNAPINQVAQVNSPWTATALVLMGLMVFLRRRIS